MRIAISTSVIQRGRSGVGQHVLALTRALLEIEGDHRLVLFVLAEDLPLFAFASARAELVAVPEPFRSAVRNIFWHHARMPALLRERQIDVLHVPSYRRMVARTPCARVATIHDLAQFHVRAKYDPARMLYGRVAVKQLARRQHELIAISSHTARDIERFFGIPQERQNIIPNGIDHSRFRPGDSQSARQEVSAQWRLDAPYFLYLSRLEHPAKNHVRLIEAFTRFKTATRSNWLLALGGSDWHGAGAIRTAAAQSPYARDIRFLGFVPDDSVPALYRAAGALVYPSLFEGFGLPPVEAMACGCPVLSSTRGALAEVLGDAAVTLDPENVEDIAAGLTALAAGGGLRPRLIEAGLANARRFDWQSHARGVLKVYRKAGQQPMPPHLRQPSQSGAMPWGHSESRAGI